MRWIVFLHILLTVGQSGKNNFLSQVQGFVWATLIHYSRPGTSKQLTLCLTHNEALLESHVGENEEGAGRESSGKRMWNICTIGFRDQENIINGQGLVHRCRWAFFILALLTRWVFDILYIFIQIPLLPTFCCCNFLMFQPHWSWCF